MHAYDRKGNPVQANETQDKVLAFLYETKPGRFCLKTLVKPWVSKLGGLVLNCPVSRVFIKPFIQKNKIDMSQYENRKFNSYNDFFMRRIKEGMRPIDENPEHLIAPCDSKLTVYPIREQAAFRIKDTSYTLEQLTHSKKIAKHYEGGWLFVFRLTVDDYHHYCFVDDGQVSRKRRIPGFLHTVNPLANDVYPIYKENTREYNLLKSKHFGTILMMEVGALMVGRIANEPYTPHVSRGMEKGHFEFGGSTVILAVQKDRVTIDEDILTHSMQGAETIVRMGERIGKVRD